MRHAWLALFLVLFFLILVAGIYDIYYPTNFLGLPVSPPSGEALEALLGLVFVGSLILA